MTSCTIIISHFNSLPFLRQCVRQIVKHSHPEIETHIIVCDQSTGEEALRVYETMLVECENIPYFKLVHTRSLYSGYGIDYLLHNNYIKTDYICQLHADVVPINNNFLYLPIKLIEENNLSFVGQLQFICNGAQSIYPPHSFFAMAQCFNVARTETYKEMSLEAGFTRFHNRPKAGMTWNNNDWGKWAEKDYKARGSDDDVVAFHWESKYRQTDKIGLAISGFIQPNFGRIIDDLVFHFCSAREAVGVMKTMPEMYQLYTQKINEDYSDALIDEMVYLAKSNKPPELEILSRNYWDGTNKISSPTSDELNKRIEELKNVD